ncbi:hypothetical protein GJ496_006181 [Pomphorhynchus laevis]|nr:hypothetical protein GJ496_006181 [Pomphorhynchus laevis]
MGLALRDRVSNDKIRKAFEVMRYQKRRGKQDSNDIAMFDISTIFQNFHSNNMNTVDYKDKGRSNPVAYSNI